MALAKEMSLVEPELPWPAKIIKSSNDLALAALMNVDDFTAKHYSKECNKFIWALLAHKEGTGPLPRFTTSPASTEATSQPGGGQQHVAPHLHNPNPPFDAGASGSSGFYPGRAQAPATPRSWRSLSRPTPGRPEATPVEPEDFDYFQNVVYRNMQ